MADDLRFDVDGLQLDLQDAAPLPHGVSGVDAQVHQDLADLGRIGHDGVRRFLEGLADLDARRQGGPEEFHGVLDDGGDPEGLGAPVPSAG